MKASSAFLTLLLSIFILKVTARYDRRALAVRHANISHFSPTLIHRAGGFKRCKVRSASQRPSQNFGATSADKRGLINVKSTCGPIGATKQTTASSGPNGSIHWLNCGLTGAGWTPPYVQISDLVHVPLVTAIKSPSSPFTACKPYISLFEKYGNEFGIPGIILASFAMQESSCNPNSVGGAGEQGLMQITKDKCGNAPGGNCRDPKFNIRAGAHFFADTLKSHNNNVILAIATYNGWREKMTFAQATAAAKTTCCLCQPNCDYLHQFVNGWLQNIDAHNSNAPLGVFFNLNICH